MNIVKIVLSLSVLFACGRMYAGTTSSSIPNGDQVAKLVAACWKAPPSSIDVTLCKEVTSPPMSLDTIRTSVNKLFDASEDGARYRKDNPEDVKARNAEIEQEVQRIVTEQQSPRILEQRIRIEGDRYRVDQVIVKPGMELAPDTPFEQTYVNSGNRRKGDGTHFDYDHNRKIATIYNNTASMWHRSDIDNAAGLPLYVRALVRGTLGKRQETQTGSVMMPDDEKIRKLTTGDLEHIGVRISIGSDENSPDTRDRIEIREPNASSQIVAIMIVDRNDYSRVYRSEVYYPKTGQPRLVRESSDFDSQGFPHDIITVEYDETGSIKRKEHLTSSKVELNPSLQDNLFSFQVPAGYAMIDQRLKKPLVVQRENWDTLPPQAREGGKSLGNASSEQPEQIAQRAQPSESPRNARESGNPTSRPMQAASDIVSPAKEVRSEPTVSHFSIGIAVAIFLMVLVVIFVVIRGTRSRK